MNPLQQMLQQIEFYRNGDLSLGALIGALEFVADSIGDQNESWKRSVHEKIGDLEQVNAVMLDRGIGELDETGRMRFTHQHSLPQRVCEECMPDPLILTP